MLLLFSLACFIASGCQVSRKVITEFRADDTVFAQDGQAASSAIVCSLCDATKIGPLNCGSNFSVSTKKSMSTSFTHGSSMTIGTKFSFEAGIPGLAKITTEMDISATDSFTVGSSETKETTTTESSDCTGTVHSGEAGVISVTFITSTVTTSFTATVTTYYDGCAATKEATSGTISISNVPTKQTSGTCSLKELGCCGGNICPTMPPTMPPSPPTPMPTRGVYYTVPNVASSLVLTQTTPVHGCKIHYNQCYWETLNEAQTGCDQWDQCGSLYCTEKHIPASHGKPVCWARQWTVATKEQGATTYVKSTQIVNDYVEVVNANVDGVLWQNTPVNRCTIKWGQCYWNNLADAEWGCNNWAACNSIYWTGKHTGGTVVGWGRASTGVGYEMGSSAYLATSALRTSSSHSYMMMAFYAAAPIAAAPVTPAPTSAPTSATTYDQEDYVAIHNVAAVGVLEQKYPVYNCSVAWDQCYWNSLEEAETNCDEWEQCESLYCTDKNLPATTGNPICWAREWTAAIREQGSTVYVKRAHAGKYVEVENVNVVGVLRQTTPVYNCSIEWEQCYWDNLEDSKSGCGKWSKCHSIYWTDKHAPATPGNPVGWARSSTATAYETGSTAFLSTSELLTSKIHHEESSPSSLSSSLTVIPEDAECKAPHNIARSDLVVMGKKLGKKLAVRLATKIGLTDSSLESSDDYEFAK